jgi:hypothetical protein
MPVSAAGSFFITRSFDRRLAAQLQYLQDQRAGDIVMMARRANKELSGPSLSFNWISYTPPSR